MRSGMWRAWCQASGKDARLSLFSWEFLRAVWSLLCNVTRAKTGREAKRRFTWRQEHLGCTAPRSAGIYGRMN
mgnify:CR=1 FL=1